MTEKLIGIKNLQNNLKRVSDDVLNGKSFLVLKNSKPVFRIVPLSEEKLPKYSLDDFKKIQFKSRSKNLSKHVDNILY
jgi:antitoxin (DNA-binding transcriptional repressor) of toxin-antitoxin stability system